MTATPIRDARGHIRFAFQVTGLQATLSGQVVTLRAMPNGEIEAGELTMRFPSQMFGIEALGSVLYLGLDTEL